MFLEKDFSLQAKHVGSGLKQQMSVETTGDEYIRLHTTEDEYIRVGIVQETTTYECLEVRGRLHTTTYQHLKAGYQFIPVGSQTSIKSTNMPGYKHLSLVSIKSITTTTMTNLESKQSD